MTERLMELRKTLTHACDLDEHDQEWIDIIDRLAAIERRVAYICDHDLQRAWTLTSKDIADVRDKLRAIIASPDHP